MGVESTFEEFKLNDDDFNFGDIINQMMIMEMIFLILLKSKQNNL